MHDAVIIRGTAREDDLARSDDARFALRPLSAVLAESRARSMTKKLDLRRLKQLGRVCPRFSLLEICFFLRLTLCSFSEQPPFMTYGSGNQHAVPSARRYTTFNARILHESEVEFVNAIW